MTNRSSLSFSQRIKNFVPSISLDCVVFGYRDNGLHVLLLKYKGTNTYALPGGFLPKHAEMEEAISDVLFDRTGLKNIFLTQFHTFSVVDRGWHSSETDRNNFQIIRSKWPEKDRSEIENWFSQRFISTAFMALVDASRVNPTPDELSESCSWFPIGALPALALDHAEMVQKAIKELRMRINYLPIGRSLLKERFTMSEIQNLYEAILGKRMDRGNFQRKMIKLGILVRHEKLMTGAPNKAPYLYSLNDKVYDRLVEDGIGFG